MWTYQGNSSYLFLDLCYLWYFWVEYKGWKFLNGTSFICNVNFFSRQFFFGILEKGNLSEQKIGGKCKTKIFNKISRNFLNFPLKFSSLPGQTNKIEIFSDNNKFELKKTSKKNKFMWHECFLFSNVYFFYSTKENWGKCWAFYFEKMLFLIWLFRYQSWVFLYIAFVSI